MRDFAWEIHYCFVRGVKIFQALAGAEPRRRATAVIAEAAQGTFVRGD
jgi:hypothetical protein